jgi:hypothetical protein
MKQDDTTVQPSGKMTDIRLDLIEYAAVHSLDELLTRALDKIGKLADSAIGFFHFVEADQKTLALQQWSTRTVNEFCLAEGKGQQTMGNSQEQRHKSRSIQQGHLKRGRYRM